jgi:hypothetical protein
MPRALKHSKIRAPGTDSLPVLVRHNPRDLVKMRQIMSRPRRQQLRQSNGAKGRMAAAAREIVRAWIQRSQFRQTLGSCCRKFIQ